MKKIDNDIRKLSQNDENEKGTIHKMWGIIRDDKSP